MYFDKNMSFWKVSGKTDIRFEISVKNCIWQHLAKICFGLFSDVRFFVPYMRSKSRFWMFNWWPFTNLINSKRSTHVHKLLNLSDLKKVARTFFKNAIYWVQETTKKRPHAFFQMFAVNHVLNVWWFQKLGASEPTPDGLALTFEFVRSKKGSFYDENTKNNSVALRGRKNQRKHHLRIQEGHFLKIALNLILTLPDDGKCPALLISCGIIDL